VDAQDEAGEPAEQLLVIPRGEGGCGLDGVCGARQGVRELGEGLFVRQGKPGCEPVSLAGEVGGGERYQRRDGVSGARFVVAEPAEDQRQPCDRQLDGWPTGAVCE
jgi:hypothetical protein